MDSQGTPHASNTNLWAPWRMEYLKGLADDQPGCFLCRDRDEPARDAEHLVLWRGSHSFVLLNRFPYTGGHCMVAPYQHTGNLSVLPGEAFAEMMSFVRDLPAILRHAIGAEGFNVGMNVGRCAGAGLPDHLHMHVVPRWSGDNNFMPVFGQVRVIPEFLSQTRDRLLAAGAELNLPAASA